MKLKFYLDKGFIPYCSLIKSDKYSKGVDTIIDEQFDDELKDSSVVYLLVGNKGQILKIGQTFNLNDRFYHYKCNNNTTNTRIRTHIKEIENIKVYVYIVPKVDKLLLGYKCTTSFSSALEEQLLKEYKSCTEKLPLLNHQLN